MSDDLADLLRLFLARLAALGTPYMIVGSVAALAHGRTRATQDIDIVVDADEQAAVDARRRSTLFNVIDMETGWKLDVVPLKRRPFSQREFVRRQALTVLGIDVFVASLEDTIVSKLEWSKLAGGSERQLDDVRELLRLAGERLDRAYVEAAVDELGLRDAWSSVDAS